jgi:hypothetical protein
MVNRSFADMRRTPVSPASCRAFFLPAHACGSSPVHIRHRSLPIIFFIAPAMTWLMVFLCVWPIALAMLFRFAARIDPRSGRWRRH